MEDPFLVDELAHINHRQYGKFVTGMSLLGPILPGQSGLQSLIYDNPVPTIIQFLL